MKRMMMALAAVIMTACSCWADTGFLFEGKIGTYPVVMSIWATATHATGDYYYVSQGPNKTLQLNGELDLECDDPIWVFEEYVNGKWNGRFRVYWDRFTLDGQRTMVGSYVNIKGKSYSVNLKLKRLLPHP